MYANRNPRNYLQNIKDSVTSMVPEDALEERNILTVIGIGVYLLSFIFPVAAGATGLGISVFTALLGSVMISKPLVFSAEFGEQKPFEKWGNYRINGPPEDEKRQEEKGGEESLFSGTTSQRPLHGIRGTIHSEEHKEYEELFEHTKVREHEEILEIPEEYVIAEEGKTDSEGQYDRTHPLLKTSRTEFLIFRTGEKNILSLPKKKESFSCPLCGEKVSWGTTKCPSCGVSFASVESGLDDVIGEEIDEYGNSILPGDIKVKAIHLDMENGSSTIYGSAKKREESKSTYGFNDDFLAGISAID